MKLTRRTIIATGAALALGAGGAAGAFALTGNGNDRSGDDRDELATGPGADRAREAALARYPGATVTAVEREDDEGATYEVELKRADGATVDVEVDRSGKVAATDADEHEED